MRDFDKDVLFQNMSEGFCISELIVNKTGTAIDYTFLEVNPAYENMLNRKRENAVGSRASDLYSPSEPPCLDIFSRVVQTGITEEIEIYFPDVEKFFVIRAFAIEGDQFAALFRDITSRAQVEDEVVEYREHLEKLVKERTKELEGKLNKQREIIEFWAGREAQVGEMKTIIRKFYKQLGDAGVEPVLDDSYLRTETRKNFQFPSTG